MRRRPPILRMFLASAVLIVAVWSSPATSVRAAPSSSGVGWSPCYREFGLPFECGTVQVPLDHDEQGGAAISIALVRLAATGPGARIGSLFFNPGGPGGSGVDFLLAIAPLIPRPLQAQFDLIGFDPRGIARSTAVRCFGNARQWSGLFTPFPFPVTPEEEALWASADQYLVEACDQRAARIIDHMSTADVARDLDLLRQAVGDELLTYVGYSYGSYLGVTYANLFPDRFRALVVDGVLDPVAWSTGAPGTASSLPFSTRLRSDAGAAATLDEFFRLCDAGGANCAFSGDAAARFAALAARLRAEPHTILNPVTGQIVPFSYADLIVNALGAMYNSFSWPAFASFLAYVEAGAAPAVLGEQLMALHRELGLITKRGIPRYRNGPEGGTTVFCLDSDNPDGYPAWAAAAAASEAEFGYFGRFWTWISSPCVNWPAASEDRHMGPFNAQTSHPVLVVGNQFDPATRYEGAVTVHDLLPNSSLLTLHGWGHTSLLLSQCATASVTRYLLTGIAPPSGTLCEQDFVPFTAPLTSTASAFEVEIRRQVRGSLIPEVLLRAAP
jgi:pimeloyl-ACP methyl ester carboxylesterase